MSSACPACSRLNPPHAVFCHYDGRPLSLERQSGALQIGSMPFAMPFCFADGKACSNFNQLALACDERWDESKALLADGTWASFFGALGRLDLSAAARQASKEPDLDVGLSHLLEKLPVDPVTLRPPNLAVPTSQEDLGTLPPGTDRTFELMISNQGMLVLRGMISTDCDWLVFGDRNGPSQKMFQTRNVYSIPVRVLGSKLRAGRKPLVAEIVVDTNGGSIAIPVKANVPIKPFPKGKYANDSLAGAMSPRELALKAKEAPAEAGVLFEQGAVKAWYAANGWTYPIEGTAGSGRAAVQQFFEALGLTKPPQLEISAQTLDVSGAPGQRVVKKLTISTKENKPVYAHGWSDRDWVKVGQGRSKGNLASVPVEFEIPARPGEKLQSSVTIIGNGRKHFVIPVTLTVSAAAPAPAEEEQEETNSNSGLWWSIAAALLLTAMAGGGAGYWFVYHRPGANATPFVEIPEPPPIPVAAPLKKNAAPWWDALPGTTLALAVDDMKKLSPQEAAAFDAVGVADPGLRRDSYEKLLSKAPELSRDPKTKEKFGRILADCYALDPSETNVAPIREWLTSQLPRPNAPFAAKNKQDQLDRAYWALRVGIDALAHDALRTEQVKHAPEDQRVADLAQSLGEALGFAIDAKASTAQLRVQSEKLLTMRHYRNAIPTASRSVDDALWLRDALIKRAPEYLSPAFRENVDLEVVAAGLAGGSDGFQKLEPILKACVDHPELPMKLKVLALYEGSPPLLAMKMEPVLAEKWKVAADPKLDHAAKAEAIRTILVGGVAVAPKKAADPAERLARMQKLTQDTLAAAKSPANKKLAVLQDAVRLAHASTMASILFQKDADLKRFDEFVGKVPEIDQTEEAPKPADPKQQPGGAPGGAIFVGAEPKIIQGVLNPASERDNVQVGSFRKVYLFALKARQTYTIDLISGAFDSYLRLEDAAGKIIAEDDDSGGALNSRLIVTPQVDANYRVIATTLGPGSVGPYTLQVQLGAGAPGFPVPIKGGFGVPLFGNPFLRGPFPRGIMPINPAMMPIPGQPQPKGEADPQTAYVAALANLDNKQAGVRVAGFAHIASKIPDDFPIRHAQRLAKYLLTIPKKDELDDVVGKLDGFAKCRNFLLSLADQVVRDEVSQKSAETIVGGVLGESLKFANNEDWRMGCRKMLLEQALDLTESKRNGAEEAADLLRDLYKEQGLAFGLKAETDFAATTRPTHVQAALIRKIAAKAAEQNPDPEDKEFLSQVDRRLQVAQFVAENDLEQAVLLQRIWIRVLAIRLQKQAPGRAEAMRRVLGELADSDRRSPSALEQIRSGEEKILRVWAAANDLK